MSQGQWRILSCPCPRDITIDKDGHPLELDKMLSESDIDENREKIENWEDDNQKAISNIML